MDATSSDMNLERSMRADEVPGETAFLVHECGFAEVRVETSFTEASDALDAADGALIKDVIVAEPKFEGKITTNRNEAMKLNVVTNGPGKAAKNYNRQRECRKF